jgi:hypothetical protein
MLMWCFRDKIYVDFTDFLTVIEFTVQLLNVQSFRPIARVVTKRALLMDPDRRALTYVTLKSWSNQKPGYNVMYPYPY